MNENEGGYIVPKPYSTVLMFFKDLFELYHKYDISIGHEDFQGGFTLERDSLKNRNWIVNADISELLESD